MQEKRPRLVLALILATLGGLGLGIVGYLTSPGWDGDTLAWEDAAFRSLQLLFLNYDTSVDPPSLSLRVARWMLAGVATVLVGLVVFFVLATEQLRRRLASMRLKGHIVVIADGDWAAEVVASLRDGDDAQHAEAAIAVLTSDEAVARHLSSAHPRVIAWTGSPEDTGALAGLRLDRSVNVIIAMSSDSASVRAAVTVREAARGTERAAPLVVVVLLASVWLTRTLVVEGFADANAETSIEFLSPIEIGTASILRRLADEGRMAAAGGDQDRVIVVGDSEVAKEVVLRAASEAGTHRRRLAVDLVGENAAASLETMHRCHPRLDEVAAITAHPKEQLLPLIAATNGLPVLICADGDPLALGRAVEALHVGGVGQRVELLVSGRSLAMDTSTTSSGLLDQLGIHSIRGQALTPNVLLNSRRETLARQIHENYIRRRRAEAKPADAGDEWDETTDYNRLSSRVAADRLLMGLRGLGYVVVPDPLVDPTGPLLAISGDRLEEGARTEHVLWRQHLERNGWSYGERRNDKAKTHPMLVAYDDLPENERQKDRDILVDAPRLLATVGLRVLEGS